MDDTPAPKPGMELEAIRARLRERGYLGGVAEWVASPRAGGWVRYAAASSLRTAVVGGPLLALPAAAAIALANRPHLSAPRDFLVLWIYLALVLGVVLALLEFATDLILAAAARSGLVLVGRAERLAGRAGLLFTAATTLYLAFLLRGGRAGSAAEGPLAWLAWGAALVAALGIGHLVGRLTRVGSLVAMLASGGSAATVQADVRSAARRRTVALVSGLALLVAGGAVIFSSGSQRQEETTGEATRALSPLPARPTPGRVVVIGVDGLARSLFEEAASDATRHPALAIVAKYGAVYPLARESGETPPSIWTSIATGRPADEHGVLGYSAEHLWGLSAPVQPAASGSGPALSLRLLWPPMHSRPGPVDAMLRRAPALWEILNAAGVKSATINWWASWPALEGGGTVVTDRALLRLLAGAPLDRDVWPNDLQRRLEEAFEETRATAVAETPDGMGSLGRRAVMVDAWHSVIARRLLEQGDPRVLLLYLPGLDIVQGGPEGDSPVESDWFLLRLNDLVAEVAKSFSSEQDLLLLVGDTGRKPRGNGSSDAQGVLAVVDGGWGSAEGRVLPGQGPAHAILDIAPTILALAGVPLALNLPGRPILGFLRPGDPAAQPGGTVATYGELSAVPGQKEDAMSDEVLDRLRSLGYIR